MTFGASASPTRLRRRSVIAIVVAAIGSACGGPIPTATPAQVTAAPTASPAAVATPTPFGTPAATPSSSPSGPPRPASGHISVVGSAGLAGEWTLMAIRCSLPRLGSLVIEVLATPPDPKFSATIWPGVGGVHVRLRTGSGRTYREEDFGLTGPATLDPASGATFDGALSSLSGGPAFAHLGRIESLAGSVDCGDQGSGSATLSFSGSGPDGPVELRRDLPPGELPSLDPVRVECDPGMVTVAGTGWAGHGLADFSLSIRPDAVSLVTDSTGSDEAHAYAVEAKGAATLTRDGANIDATLVARIQYGHLFRTYRVHVGGDVKCGVFGNF